MGQAALVLARRLDADVDTGSALAAVVKQLQTTLDEVLRGSRHTAPDLLRDELARRRAAHGGN